MNIVYSCTVCQKGHIIYGKKCVQSLYITVHTVHTYKTKLTEKHQNSLFAD